MAQKMVWTLSMVTLDEHVKYLKSDGTLTYRKDEAETFTTKKQAENKAAKSDRILYAYGYYETN